MLALEGDSNWYENKNDINGNPIKNPSLSDNINHLKEREIFPHAITGKLDDIRHSGNTGMHDDTRELSESTIAQLTTKLHDILIYFINTYDGTNYRYDSPSLNAQADRRPDLFKKRPVARNNTISTTSNTYHSSSNYNRPRNTMRSNSSSNYGSYSNNSSYRSSSSNEQPRATIHYDYEAPENYSAHNDEEDPRAATKRSHHRILGAIVAILAIIFVIHSCSSSGSSSSNYDSFDSCSDDSDSDDSSNSSNQYKGNWINCY